MSDIKSKPITQAYADGWDATFGNRNPVRGRFIWDAKANRLVPEGEYIPDAPEPTRVPVLTDRYMEGVRAPDGTDISSRAKRRQYFREHGLTDASDYRQAWAKAAEQRANGGKSPNDRETLKRQVADVVYGRIPSKRKP